MAHLVCSRAAIAYPYLHGQSPAGPNENGRKANTPKSKAAHMHGPGAAGCTGLGRSLSGPVPPAHSFLPGPLEITIHSSTLTCMLDGTPRMLRQRRQRRGTLWTAWTHGSSGRGPLLPVATMCGEVSVGALLLPALAWARSENICQGGAFGHQGCRSSSRLVQHKRISNLERCVPG